MPGACRGQEKGLDDRELELELVLSLFVDVENEHRSSAKAAAALNCQAVSLGVFECVPHLVEKVPSHSLLVGGYY